MASVTSTSGGKIPVDSTETAQRYKSARPLRSFSLQLAPAFAPHLPLRCTSASQTFAAARNKPSRSTNTSYPEAAQNHNLSGSPQEYKHRKTNDAREKWETETKVHILASPCLFAQSTIGLSVLQKMGHLQM